MSYVLRSFPVLSEQFVLRELLALHDAGVRLEIWRLLPAPGVIGPVRGAGDADRDAPELEALRPLLRDAPRGARGLLRMAADLADIALRRPGRTLAATAWAVRWSARERDPRHLAALLPAAHLARHARAPHLHAHFANTPATVALLAARLSAPGRTASFTGHARDLWVVTSVAFLREKVTRAAFVATGTDDAVRRIRAVARPADRERVAYVPNVIRHPDDVAAGSADESSATDLESATAAGRPTESGPRPAADDRSTDRPTVVVSVARAVEKKGLDTLVRAFALLADEVPETEADLRLELIGDGPERAALQALAGELGIADRVAFRGALPPAGVDDALHRATLFALLARETADGDADGLPVAILEAQAHGLAVVSTPVAGISEAVVDGETGLLAAPGDAAQAAQAIRRLLDDPELRARLGTEGRARALAGHGAPAASAALLALLPAPPR